MTFPFPLFSPSVTGSPSFYRGEYSSSVAGATHTFTNVDLGPTATNRIVYVSIGAFSGGSNSTLVSATIAGNSASVIGSNFTSGGTGCFMLNQPTGSSVTITATLSTSFVGATIWVWAFPSLVAPIRTAATSVISTSFSLGALPVYPNGFVAGSVYAAGSPTVTLSWTGSDPLTVRRQSGIYTAADILTTETATPILSGTLSGSQTVKPTFTSFSPVIGSYYTPVLASTPTSLTVGSVQTFTGTSTGTANAARVLVLSLCWTYSTNRSVTSITVDGNAATILTQTNNNAIASIPYPTGATANIVVNFSGSVNSLCVGVWDTRPRASKYLIAGTIANLVGAGVVLPGISVADGGFLLCGAYMSITAAATPYYNGANSPSAVTQVALSAGASANYFSVQTSENTNNGVVGITTAASSNKRMHSVSFV